MGNYINVVYSSLTMKYVSVVIQNMGGEHLLQLRESVSGVAFRGCWGFFGGAIEKGESFIDAAIRELSEELELKIGKKDLKFLFEINSSSGEGAVFLLKMDFKISGLVLNEGADMKLFSYDEMKKVLKKTPELEKYCDIFR